MYIYRYPWPASALTPADMARLHAVREESSPRIPITELIARAVRMAFGEEAQPHVRDTPNQSLKEAA